MSAPATGPLKPYTSSPMAAASDSVAVDQPRSPCIGSSHAPGAERMPADSINTGTVTATTIQP